MFTKEELKTIMQLADAKSINSESIIDRLHYETIEEMTEWCEEYSR